MAEITMPKMSDTMEEGKVIKWLKNPGDSVVPGEPIAEIETDKANVEMEAFEAGVLTTIIVPEGETVPVGTAIAELQTSTATAAEPRVQTATVPNAEPQQQPETAPREEPKAPPEITPAAQPPKIPEQVTQAVPPSRVSGTCPTPPLDIEMERTAPSEELIAASPLARRMARESGIDLSRLKGTGPNGRIVEADIQNYLNKTQQPAAPEPVFAAPSAPIQTPESAEPREEIEPLSKIRKVVAERMANSKQNIPHFYVTSEIDMEWASRVREELNSEEGQVKISFNDMIMKACALALVKFPHANAFFSEDGLKLHNDINIGMAVALDEGLIVPVIHNADKKSLREIATMSRELAERARENQLRQSEFTGATFTVTNLGMFDVDNFIAIINPPESATLAVGTIMEIPVIRNGQIAASRRMKITLSADHRVMDGAVAAKFLQEVKRRLESPIAML